jgi:hypothetical protein
MQAVLCEGLSEEQARIAAVIGKAIGRWIYLVDAADDYAEDRKRERFNPYLSLFKEKPTQEELQGLQAALTALLADAERGVLLLEDAPAPEVKAIIYNVLYLGLPPVARRATTAMLSESKQQKRKGKRDEQSV